MTTHSIVDRLRSGETFLLDGGTGSELQRRGADVLKEAEDRLKAWSATANVEYADVVQQVHSDYLRVGARHRHQQQFLDDAPPVSNGLASVITGASTRQQRPATQ